MWRLENISSMVAVVTFRTVICFELARALTKMPYFGTTAQDTPPAWFVNSYLNLWLPINLAIACRLTKAVEKFIVSYPESFRARSSVLAFEPIVSPFHLELVR